MKFFFTIAILTLSINAFAQSPNDSLVLYYPFNYSAVDISGNNFDGIVYGATSIKDRFGINKSAYHFDGINDYIQTPLTYNVDTISISFWIKPSDNNEGWIIAGKTQTALQSFAIGINFVNNSGNFIFDGSGGANGYVYDFTDGGTITDSTQWHHVVLAYHNGSRQAYVDGGLVPTTMPPSGWLLMPIQSVMVGRRMQWDTNNWPNGDSLGYRYYRGDLDDIKIFKGFLSASDVQNLYYEGICNQHITTTDTLIINTNLTGFNPITYQNSIKIYPNPTNDHITIDFGSNYATMNGYTLKITNSLSQTVYTTPINTQQTTVNLSTWTGNGIYFVHLIDAQSNTIDIRKIVLQ